MAIKNIIFDLGGVVLNLDQNKTFTEFQKLGADPEKLNLNSKVLLDFELGKINSGIFINELRTLLNKGTTDEQIKFAWNSMLLELPAERIEIIRQLKNNYRLFLLSNTNSIHIEAVYEEHGKVVFDELFEKQFLSHEMGLRKPDVSCYDFVINDLDIEKSETVFVDDSPVNIKGAAAAGLKTIWAREPVGLWFEEELRVASFQNSLT